MARTAKNRIEVLHGVNLDQLNRRDPGHYGGLSLSELEFQIRGWARDLGLETVFFQTNYEGKYVEHLHRLPEQADGVILNPGAWTHYSYAIHDALEIAGLPSVEVHLSDVSRRESWRTVSVLSDLVIATVAGRGPDGYREALGILQKEFQSGESPQLGNK